LTLFYAEITLAASDLQIIKNYTTEEDVYTATSILYQYISLEEVLDISIII